MTAPMCPVHQTPMRPSTKGSGFFCSQKNPDGKYCREKSDGVPAPSPTAVATAGSSADPGAGSRHPDTALAVAALSFAAKFVEHGEPNENGDLVRLTRDEALSFAQDVFQAMKAVLL